MREVVSQSPSAIAVETATNRVSYAELDHQADLIATTLLKEASGPGGIVVVLVSDRAALVSIMLGAWRSGCIFVPLDISMPKDRLSRIVKRLGPTAILTIDADRSLAVQLADQVEGGCVIVTLPSLASLDRTTTPTNADRRQTPPPDAPAYIYFTSGSTGQPRGVVGCRKSLAARIAWQIEQFQLPIGVRTSQLISPTFDAWFRDILVPLCVGGTVCIPPSPPAETSPERLLEWIRDSRIGLMHCGPALMNVLLSTPPRIRRLPDLQLMLLSGEFLHVSAVARWRKRFRRPTTLVNLYGATEATMIQFFHVVQPEDLRRDFIPIGRPLPGEHALLIDASGNSCEPGQVGEVWIGGSALTLGYYRDEQATRESFVDVPFADGRTRRVYRTGDLAVQHDDGNFQLLGRQDDQLKIRGVRVEPREVEDALLGYPLVGACAVKGAECAGGDLELVAYVVPDSQYPPAISDMRAYLRERVPTQMIPARFVLLDRLPLTNTGKVDRGALPEPDWSTSDTGQVTVEPRNSLEVTLAEYWCEILGLVSVGVHDNFLDLGGHSLSAMRLVNTLRGALQLDLAVRDIFECPTIAELSELIQDRGGASAAGTIASESPIARPPSLDSSATKTQHPTESSNADPWQFGCPAQPSPWFGKRQCNLVLVHGRYGERDSFSRVAHWVEQWDPSIRAVITPDQPQWQVDVPIRPTLVFSPALIRHRPDRLGRICCGYPLSKSEEYVALEETGISVPRWITLREGESPDLEGFGDYVVRKPDYGAKGAEVRIVHRDRLRWKRIVTSAAGPSPTLIVQQFIYTGPWPVSYRVNTLFGKVMFAVRLRGRTDRPALRGPSDFGSLGWGQSVSIVSNARDSLAEYCDDPEVIRLGEQAHGAFPDLPMLGIDIVKDAETGALYVIEVNALGHNWNFTDEFRQDFRLDVEKQFDGERKAAYVLAEQTQKLSE